MKNKGLFIFLWILLVHKIYASSRDERILALSQAIETYGSVLNAIDKQYLFEVDIQTVAKHSLEAIFANLDPYSKLLTSHYNPKFLDKDFAKEFSNNLGIDIIVDTQLKNHIVVFANSPAQIAGLLPGDELFKINDIDVQSFSGAKIVKLLAQKLPLQLSVKRNSEILQISVNKIESAYKRKNVIYYCLIKQTIGYVKLIEFAKGAAAETIRILEGFSQATCKGFILDLRGNNGGVVSEVVELLSYFLPPETIVIKTIGRDSETVEEYKTSNYIEHAPKPIVVIIDQTTASAAEIFAGCMQDYDRGIIIGEVSFGKGTIQTVENILYDKILKLTTSQYYLPSGRFFSSLKMNKQRTEYKSLKGRKFHCNCSGGIVPDENVCKISNSLLSELSESRLIAQYAQLYRSKNKNKVDINSFRLSDQAFEQFLSWVNAHNLDYDKDLDKLRVYLVNNKYDLSVIGQLNLLRTSVKKVQCAKLRRLKPQLKDLIEQEIVDQYHMFEGKVEFAIRSDKPIQRAIQILENSKIFNSILKI